MYVKVVHFKLGESLSKTKALIKRFVPSKQDRRLLYVHASPPCKQLSSMNRYGSMHEGMRMVHWTIDLFERLKARTMTTENVPQMDKLFYRRGYSSRVVDASLCSATPQARKRAIITNFKFHPRKHKLHIPASCVLPHLDPNIVRIQNRYGHAIPLDQPSLTVVGQGLYYLYGNGNTALMPATDGYLLQGGRPSHLPIIAALPLVFGRQCVGDMIPPPLMEVIALEGFKASIADLPTTRRTSSKIWQQTYSAFDDGNLNLVSRTGPTFFACTNRAATKTARASDFFDLLTLIQGSHQRRLDRDRKERTYRVDFEYGEFVDLDRAKVLAAFRCEYASFVVDGVA